MGSNLNNKRVHVDRRAAACQVLQVAIRVPAITLALCGILASIPAFAQELQTVIGEVRTGTLDSAVGEYGFHTTSTVGAAIFSACQMGEICKVEGIIKDDWIIAVAKAEKNDSSSKSMPSSTAETNTTSFVSLRSDRFGEWYVHLYRNAKSQRLFCALEARRSGVEFRVNYYKDRSDIFLEVFSPKWTLKQGDGRFSLEFDIRPEPISAEFAGKLWADSFTYDFANVDRLNLFLGILAKMRGFEVRNGEGESVARFGGKGSAEAVAAYVACADAN